MYGVLFRIKPTDLKTSIIDKEYTQSYLKRSGYNDSKNQSKQKNYYNRYLKGKYSKSWTEQEKYYGPFLEGRRRVRSDWGNQPGYHGPFLKDKYWDDGYVKEFIKPKRKRTNIPKSATTSNPTKNSVALMVRDAGNKIDPGTKQKLFDEERKNPPIHDKGPASKKAYETSTTKATPTSQASGNVSIRNNMKWMRRHPKMTRAAWNIRKFANGNRKSIIQAAALVAGTMAISKLTTSYNNTNNFIKTPRFSNMDNRSAYMPNSYKKGFAEIKELTTDFGSKVHLDKTTSKVMVAPRNNTRHNLTTNTKQVISGNLALTAHANAINHTRY